MVGNSATTIFYKSRKNEEEMNTVEKVIRIDEHFVSMTSDSIISKEKDTLPIIEHHEVETSEFLKKCNELFQLDNTESFVLPKKCRFSKQYIPSHDEHKFLFVIEEEPTIRTIRVNLPMEAPIERIRKEGKLEQFGYKDFQFNVLGEPYFFKLSFPYVIHVLLLTLSVEQTPTFHHWLFYRLNPLKSTFDYLLRPNLPNIDGQYKVCPGDYKIKETAIPDMVDEYLHTFWSSIFNKDYSTHYMFYDEDEYVCDFLHWQYYSHTDPTFFFNSEWDKARSNLEDQIENIQDYYGLRQSSGLTLEQFEDLISSPNLSFKKTKPQVLFTNWIDSIWVDSFHLSIGDKLRIGKNKDFYIKDFQKISRQTFIVLEDEKGKEFRIKDTYELRKKLAKNFLAKKYEQSIVIDNIHYAVGDTVLIEEPSAFQTYSNITSIIKNRAGKYLIVLQNGKKYFTSNIKLQKFNKNKITVGDTTLTTGEKFILLSTYHSNYLSPYQQLVFKQATIDYGNLVYEFQSYGSGRQITKKLYPNEIKQWTIVSENDPQVRQIPSLVLGGRLVRVEGGFLLYNNRLFIRDWYALDNEPFDQIKLFATEDEIAFPHLKPYKVGDKICIALWDEPTEMVKIRTITKFIIDSPNKKIFVETNDGTTTRTDPIVINDKILYSSFKHIETEYGRLKSGMILKPLRIGISCFPKKSSYKIIGFIRVNFVDIPMVLMSNCCTLWPFQLTNDFTISSENVENPDITKIKVQDHDLLSMDTKDFADYILLHEPKYAGLRMYNTKEILGTTTGYALTTLPKYAKRMGFIYPRFGDSSNIVKHGWVDGLGNIFIESNQESKGKFKFIFDKRLFDV